jgi:DNA polymerase III sliding clamp (beta) subunit (PCNA family)
MKAIVNRQELIDALSKVKRGVATKGHADVLKMVRFSAGKGRLEVTGGDGEIFLIASCKAKVTKAGTICADLKRMEPFLKAISTATVAIIGNVDVEEYPDIERHYDPEAEGGWREEEVTRTRVTCQAAIECDQATTQLAAKQADDYPNVNIFRGAGVKIANFSQALSEVGYAMAREEYRAVLCGVCIRKGQMIACDGHRLAVTKVNVRGKLDGDLVIAREVAEIISKTMDAPTIRIRSEKDNPRRHLIVEDKGLTIVSHDVAGDYPDYQQLIPKGGTALKVDGDELRKAVVLVGRSQPDTNRIQLRTKGKSLTVSAKYEDNRTETKVPAQGRIDIDFDIKYLFDLLQRMGGNLVIRTQKQDSGPAMVKQSGTTHVIMPLRR